MKHLGFTALVPALLAVGGGAIAGEGRSAATEVSGSVEGPATPVEPLPRSDGGSAGAPAARPVPSVPARPPSLLDPFPGTPGGPALPENPALVVDPRPAANRINLQAAFSHRFGQAAVDTPPRAGFALGASYAHRAVLLGRGLSLWGSVEFSYDRHVGEDQLEPSTPGATPETRDRPLTQTSFVLLPFVNGELGKISLWGGAGFGASLGYFHTTDAVDEKADFDATELVWRAAGGADFAFRPDWAIGVRAAVTSALWPSLPRRETASASNLRIFGAWANYGLQLQNRF